MLAEDEALSPKLRSFKQGVEGLASLLGHGGQSGDLTHALRLFRSRNSNGYSQGREAEF